MSNSHKETDMRDEVDEMRSRMHTLHCRNLGVHLGKYNRDLICSSANIISFTRQCLCLCSAQFE